MIVDGQDIIDTSKCMVEGHGQFFCYCPITVSEQILPHVNTRISLPIKEHNQCTFECQQIVGRPGLQRLDRYCLQESQKGDLCHCFYVFDFNFYSRLSRLIDYLLFYVPLKNISLIWRHLGLYLALRVLEQKGIFIVPHLM